MALGRAQRYARPVGLAMAVAGTMVAIMFAAAPVPAQSDRSRLEVAQRALAAGDHERARAELEDLASRTSGELLDETLFVLAGLQREKPEAERLYRRVIDSNPSGEWARRSQLELAKIEYALGNYARAYSILNEARVCDISDEACLFEGLSAISLGRYDAAQAPLSRIRRGKLRAWASLSLAEAASGRNDRQEACRRYETLAGTMISPTALYRYGECLEDEGDQNGALKEFRRIVQSFPDTQEAVLAAEKLQRIGTPPPVRESKPEEETKEPMAVLESGFTIQFGSFRDRGNAIKLAGKIKRVYPGVRIDSELVSYREYHRVRYGYFRTREEAVAKAQQISTEMNEDYTIMPLP